MSEKIYRIAIVGDNAQLYMTCSHLSNHLRNLSIEIIPVLVDSSTEDTLRHAFTPFTPTLAPALKSRHSSTSRAFGEASITTPNSDTPLAFNFSDYGKASAAVNFHQALEITSQNSLTPLNISQFATRDKQTFGICYSHKTIKRHFQTSCNLDNIYTVYAGGISVKKDGSKIVNITTRDGKVINADIYIDCSNKQLLMREVQEATLIPTQYIPPYSQNSMLNDCDEGSADSQVLITEDRIQCKLKAGSAAEERTYQFNSEQSNSTASFFETPWIENCIALGQGYCNLPNVLICTDRILETQLSIVCEILPIKTASSAVQSHLKSHSERVLNDAIDSINLLIFRNARGCELTVKNNKRLQLFKSSAAMHQSEYSMINNNCWGALMRVCGVKPNNTNALAKSRSAEDITDKVLNLTTGV